MPLPRSARSRLILLVPILVAPLCGCDLSPLFSAPAGSTPSETFVVLAANVASSLDVVSGDGAGDDFSLAQPLDLPALGKVQVQGVLTAATDVDVYVMGPIAAGDVLVVDVHAPGVDTRAALFDENQALLEGNDDRNYYAGQHDPYIQCVMRRSHSLVYVAISPAQSVAHSESLDGSYSIDITRGAGAPIPDPAPQVVWLEFDGGFNVQIAGERPQSVPAFDVGAINPAHKAAQSTIINRFFALMQADYAPYNVTLLRSDRDARPDGKYSTLYFGGYSSIYLGLADSVDYYNAEPSQSAIIYTDTLRLFEALRPTDDQVAQAIANVAAHEMGHLLGLEHTFDANDLMSEASSAEQVLNIDETFMLTPLARSVFPIGQENNPMKLAQAVGLRDPHMTLDDFLNAQPVSVQNAGGAARLKTAGDGVALESLGLQMCNHRHAAP